MSENRNTYKPNIEDNILPVNSQEKAKVGKKNLVNLQLTHTLIDSQSQSQEEESISSKSYLQRNLNQVAYNTDFEELQQSRESGLGETYQGVMTKKTPQPAKLMTGPEYLSQLPEVCPTLSRAISGICCPPRSQSCLDSTSYTYYGDSEYDTTDMSSSMKQLIPLDRGEDSSAFISGLLSTDQPDDSSFVRSFIPTTDDSTAAAAQDKFFKSLIINPGDMPDWERATLLSKPDNDVFYDRFYLEQSSPTSEQNIPIGDGSSGTLPQDQKVKEAKAAAVCEQDLYCKKNLYTKYPPLIQKQHFSRFPGPRNPRICTLRCSYKPCLPMRKQALQCLLRNEYCECEKALCKMGLGFITTQP